MRHRPPHVALARQTWKDLESPKNRPLHPKVAHHWQSLRERSPYLTHTYIHMYIYIYFYLFIYLFVCLSSHLFIHLFICRHVSICCDIWLYITLEIVITMSTTIIAVTKIGHWLSRDWFQKQGHLTDGKQLEASYFRGSARMTNTGASYCRLQELGV